MNEYQFEVRSPKFDCITNIYIYIKLYIYIDIINHVRVSLDRDTEDIKNIHAQH